MNIAIVGRLFDFRVSIGRTIFVVIITVASLWITALLIQQAAIQRLTIQMATLLIGTPTALILVIMSAFTGPKKATEIKYLTWFFAGYTVLLLLLNRISAIFGI